MLFEAAARTILQTAGVIVTHADGLPRHDPPFLGYVDGLEVRIQKGLADSDATWLALHLTGHALQWAADPKDRERDLAFERLKTPVDEVRAYEQRAGNFALWLCQRALGDRSTVWFVARSQRDWENYAAFMGRGEAGRLVLSARPPSPKPLGLFVPGGAYEV